MRFRVRGWRSTIPAGASGEVFLEDDNWDDYSFKTLFHLTYVDDAGKRFDIGAVKIACFGMGTSGRTHLDSSFDSVPDDYFSLGQSDDYYENLNALGATTRDAVLLGLRDIAADLELLDTALSEDVTGTSLMRTVSLASIRGQFHRLSAGGARLSQYDFSYVLPPGPTKHAEAETLSFVVTPESLPPTNLHVIVGRNGVGKTRMLNHMAQSLVHDEPADQVGFFELADESAEKGYVGRSGVTSA